MQALLDFISKHRQVDFIIGETTSTKGIAPKLPTKAPPSPPVSVFLHYAKVVDAAAAGTDADADADASLSFLIICARRNGGKTECWYTT